MNNKFREDCKFFSKLKGSDTFCMCKRKIPKIEIIRRCSEPRFPDVLCETFYAKENDVSKAECEAAFRVVNETKQLKPKERKILLEKKLHNT